MTDFYSIFSKAYGSDFVNVLLRYFHGFRKGFFFCVIKACRMMCSDLSLCTQSLAHLQNPTEVNQAQYMYVRFCPYRTPFDSMACKI